ncbi:MAG: CBS domain-containing protein [Deltaproteobacteria bacterium]|jgi:CBS domain-containing protein|nr:CBS domain-containing protein [Deltaproteobacteria bacterium]
MPQSTFSEESFFFLHIEGICRSPADTCPANIHVVEAARRMKEQNISGLIVTDGQAPIGVLSVSDLRNLIVSSSGNLAHSMVGEVMTPGVITIGHRAYFFEAIFKMAKNNVHRLAVVDDQKRLVGVITDTDLLGLQTQSPLYLTQEMDIADSIDSLREINSRIFDMVRCATGAGADTRSLVQLISHFNDSFTQRIIELMASKEGIALPAGAAYLALGSEGRGEQTLRTDQDSAMVYADNLSSNEIDACARFSERLVEALEYVGVPRCPGNTMASNPSWRLSLSQWKTKLNHWIATPVAENMVNFGMFQDFRTLHGDRSLEEALHTHIFAATQRNKLFFPYVAKNIVRFPAPLGMFGRIKVERRGANRGKVDLKKAGIFAITEGASLLALEQNINQGTTWDKLERLGEIGVLSEKDCSSISEAYTQLVHFRLNRQIQDLANGLKPSNCIDPQRMPEKLRNQLREALRGVNQLLRFIREHYRLDFISR